MAYNAQFSFAIYIPDTIKRTTDPQTKICLYENVD